MLLTPLHKQLLNDYQHDFPLSPRPYQEIANALGVSEDDVLSALSELNEQDFISRIGSVIRPNRIGVSSLVAMTIPPEQLAEIAEIISRYDEVNHNYERENRFNLWFVLIANDELHLQNILQEIEQKTGFFTMKLPLLNDYYINLGFELELND